MRMARGTFVFAALALSACTTPGPTARKLAGAGADTAPAVSSTVTAPVFQDCIGEEDRARAREVVRAREANLPFQPSGVYLPPLYMANAEHSIEWSGLLYLQLTDFA